MTTAATVTTLPDFDELLPNAPFTERHERIVDAPIAVVWPHCLAVNATDIRLLGPLMSLRGIPARITDRPAPSTTTPQPLLDVFEREGFVILRRDDAPVDGHASIVFGAAGRFWSVNGNAPVAFDTATDFVAFNGAGFAKTVCRLDAEDLGDGTTRIVTETLVDGTDTESTKHFGWYWRLIRLPSGGIRRSWLAAIDRRVDRVGR